MARQPSSPLALVHERIWEFVLGDQKGAIRLQEFVDTTERLTIAVASATETKHPAHECGAVTALGVQLMEWLDLQDGFKPSAWAADSASAIMSGETSTPSTSRPSRRSGIRIRPVPHPRSRAGSPKRRMALRK